LVDISALTVESPPPFPLLARASWLCAGTHEYLSEFNSLMVPGFPRFVAALRCVAPRFRFRLLFVSPQLFDFFMAHVAPAVATPACTLPDTMTEDVAI